MDKTEPAAAPAPAAPPVAPDGRSRPAGVTDDTRFARTTRLAPGQTTDAVSGRRDVLVESVRFRPDSFDAATRTFEAVFTTAAPVRRWFGDEILSISAEAIDLGRLPTGQIRFLDHHNAYERGAVLGVVEKAWIEGDALVGTVRMGETPAAIEAAGQIERGELTGISVGYRVSKWQITAVDEATGREEWSAVRWTLLEVSLVSVQADAAAMVRSHAGPVVDPAAIAATVREAVASALRSLSPSAAPKPAARSTTGAVPMEDTEVSGRAVDTTVTSPPPVDVAAAIRAERERCAEIRALATRAGRTALGEDHAARDTSVEAFRGLLLDAMVAEQETAPVRGTARIGRDETEARRNAAIDYLCVHGTAAPIPEAARQFRGMKIVDLARDVLAWSGIDCRGMTADEIAGRALTSGDFPLLLAAVVNKTLRAAYEAAPQTFRPFTRQIQLADFKLAHILRKGLTPGLELLGEHGEYHEGSIAESDETIGLKTYGRMVSMTRQMIINDDMGAFRSIPTEFGQSATTLESDLVWGILLANAALKSDGVPLFHATHANLGAAAAIGASELAKGRVAMGKQKDLDGVTTLNIQPEYLLIPPELEEAADQILADFVPTQASAVTVRSVKRLRDGLIVEGRLSNGVVKPKIGISAAGSPTAYYLASTQVDTVVYATLTGQTGPYVESQMGFDVDGVKIKCRHDFAAAAGDFRGLWKNPGA